MVRGMRPQDLARVAIVHDNVVVGGAAGFGAGSDGTGALVGYRLARNLGLDVGDRITLIAPTGATTPFGVAPARQSFEIAGLFQGGVQAFDQAFVFIPLTAAQDFLGRGERVDRIEVRVADPDDVDSTVTALQALAPGAPVADWRAENQAYFTALEVERAMMRIIFLVLVLITSLNIITGLVMLVKNKGRDIAVLRTMGASRGAVMRIFILVGLMIGLSGVLIGLTIGVVFCMNIGLIQDFIDWATGVQVFNPEIYQLSRLPAEIDPAEVIGVTVWGFLTSLLVTLLPSWNAARLDPVEALRYE
jgi:lipoprotein-releasing system permease protein